MRKLIENILAKLGSKQGNASGADAAAVEERRAAMEKYRHCYDYSVEMLKEETERFNKADDKAAKLSTNALLLIGANAFFGKWITENLFPVQSCLEWVFVGTGVGALLSACIGWGFAHWALRVRSLDRRPFNEETIRFYDETGLLDIYGSQTRSFAKAMEFNADATKRKYALLQKSFQALGVSMVLLAIVACFYTCHQWAAAPRYEKSSAKALKEQQNSKPEENAHTAPAASEDKKGATNSLPLADETKKLSLKPNPLIKAPELMQCLASRPDPKAESETDS